MGCEIAARFKKSEKVGKAQFVLVLAALQRGEREPEADGAGQDTRGPAAPRHADSLGHDVPSFTTSRTEKPIRTNEQCHGLAPGPAGKVAGHDTDPLRQVHNLVPMDLPVLPMED